MKTKFLLAILATQVAIKGMVCPYCARGLREVLRKQPKVERFEIDVDSGKLTLWGKQALEQKEIRQWVEAAGLAVAP